MLQKKAALITGIVLLAAAAVYFLFFPMYGRKTFSSQALTGGKAEKLMTRLDETGEDILTGLVFAGEELPEDIGSGTFYLPVDMDDARWETGVFSAADDGVEVYLLDNPLLDDKSEAVSSGKSYRLLAVKGDAWRLYYVIFTGLPIITLDTDEGTEIRYDEAYGTMKLYEADSKTTGWVTESLMSGHIRGGSSRLNPKKSYKITLYKESQTGIYTTSANKQSLLGMREDDEWLLYAMYSESTKARDKLSMDIWNEAYADDIDEDGDGFYGWHMEYVEVFQNGEYYGIYGLMEPVDYKQLDLTKEGESAPEEYLYKQKDADVFELKGPHACDTEEAMEVLEEYLEVLYADDSVFASEISGLIDVENALDVWLYLQAVIGMDNIERNIFYPAVWEDGQYVIRFMPWDMDYTFGSVHDFDAGNRTRASEEILTMRIAWSLGDRLIELDVDGAREYVTARWKELRETVYSDEWLSSRIDSYESSVIDSGAFARDMERWENGGHDSDYESFKELVLDRMAFLDEYMDDPYAYLDLEEYVE